MLKSADEWLPRMHAGCDNPGVRSLNDMLTVYAADYVWLGSALRHLALTLRDTQADISAEDRAQMLKLLPDIEERCTRIELKQTPEMIQFVIHILKSDRPVSRIEAQSCLNYVENVLQKDLESVKFFYVEKAKTEEYEKMVPEQGDALSQLFGDPWPIAAAQLDHARRCYIADEFTASVFHSMRAAEKVLSTVAQSLSVEFRRENWQKVIEKIESAAKDLDQLPKGDDREQKQAFYGEIAMQLRCIKNAWRNHVMHARKDYNEEQARAIWWHVKRTVEFAYEGELEEAIDQG